MHAMRGVQRRGKAKIRMNMKTQSRMSLKTQSLMSLKTSCRMCLKPQNCMFPMTLAGEARVQERRV